MHFRLLLEQLLQLRILITEDLVPLRSNLLCVLARLRALAFPHGFEGSLRGLLEFLERLPGESLLETELRGALRTSDACVE